MIEPVSRSSALAWLPSMETLPEVGAIRPPRICMSVVLPEPLGPTRAVTVASPSVSEMSRSAASFSPGYV